MSKYQETKWSVFSWPEKWSVFKNKYISFSSIYLYFCEAQRKAKKEALFCKTHQSKTMQAFLPVHQSNPIQFLPKLLIVVLLLAISFLFYFIFSNRIFCLYIYLFEDKNSYVRLWQTPHADVKEHQRLMRPTHIILSTWMCKETSFIFHLLFPFLVH